MKVCTSLTLKNKNDNARELDSLNIIQIKY